MVSLIVAAWVLWAAMVTSLVCAQPREAVHDAESRGQSVGEAIDLQAGPTCLGEERLERRVSRWLGRELVDPGLRIWVRGGPSENRVQFTLRRDSDAPTQRDLGEVPGDCGDRHAAVALAIALAIDAGQLGSLKGGDLAPAGQEAPDAGLHLAIVPKDAWTLTASSSVVGGLGVGLLTAASPTVSAAVHLGVHQQLELRMSALWSNLSSQRAPQVAAPVSYAVRMLVGGAALCPVVRGDLFELAACGGVFGGLFTTIADGLPTSGEDAGEYWAATLGLDFHLQLSGPFMLRVAVDLILPFSSRSLVVFDQFSMPITVAEMGPAAVCVAVGPMVRFF